MTMILINFALNLDHQGLQGKCLTLQRLEGFKSGWDVVCLPKMAIVTTGGDFAGYHLSHLGGAFGHQL